MLIISLRKAKSKLVELVVALQIGKQSEIILTKRGRPAARLIPIARAKQRPNKNKRIGIAAGKFQVPDAIDTHNDKVLRSFLGDSAL